MQRPVSIALVVLLGVAASLAIVFGGGSQPPPGDHRSATVTIVRGLVDPSSAPFFSDPRVRKEFAAHGLQVQVESRQSAEMARSTDLDAYDFAFSANLSVAKKIQ